MHEIKMMETWWSGGGVGQCSEWLRSVEYGIIGRKSRRECHKDYLRSYWKQDLGQERCWRVASSQKLKSLRNKSDLWVSRWLAQWREWQHQRTWVKTNTEQGEELGERENGLKEKMKSKEDPFPTSKSSGMKALERLWGQQYPWGMSQVCFRKRRWKK